ASLLMIVAHAHDSAHVDGTWHVAVPAWGIEDHVLVVEEHDGALAGKFEFADVKGTVAGERVRFEVSDPSGGRRLLSFDGAIWGDERRGTVTSPEDGQMVQHGLADRHHTTAEWTASRETTSPR